MTVPIRVHAEVVGLVDVTEHLRAVPAQRRARIARTIRRLGIELTNKVRREKLTGQVLNVQTGDLRRSINERFRDDSHRDEISTTVGTAKKYGRAWELGFSGVFTVREHIRRVRSRDVVARSRPMASLEGRRRRVTLAEGIAFVRSHSRTVHQPARPFLRPALAESRAAAIAAIVEAAGGE